jgi:thymidylate synthase (FAD)
MKIIHPSYAILDTLDSESLAVRIEYCGRICYKSEDKINRDTAIPFVEKMAEHGHNSVLEMGVVTLQISCRDFSPIYDFYLKQPKYFHLDLNENNTLLITGSVRAFREMLLFNPGCSIAGACVHYLNQKHPYFFRTITALSAFKDNNSIKVHKVDLNQVEQLPPEQLARHRHLAVKFIVNRAITHEIVRHRPCSFLQESQRYCRYSENKFGGEVTFIKPMFFSEESTEFSIWKQAMEDTEKLYLQLLETSSPQAARTVLPNSCKTELIVYANLVEWKHIFNLRTTKAAEPSMREVMIPLEQEFRNRYPSIFHQ